MSLIGYRDPHTLKNGSRNGPDNRTTRDTECATVDSNRLEKELISTMRETILDSQTLTRAITTCIIVRLSFEYTTGAGPGTKREP